MRRDKKIAVEKSSNEVFGVKTVIPKVLLWIEQMKSVVVKTSTFKKAVE